MCMECALFQMITLPMISFFQDATKQSESSLTALMKFKHFCFGSCREKLTGRSHLSKRLFSVVCYICIYVFTEKLWKQHNGHRVHHITVGPAVLCSQEGKILLGSTFLSIKLLIFFFFPQSIFFSNPVTDASLCGMNPYGIPGAAQASLAL